MSGQIERLNRNLDGVYFRVKRNNKFENICFSDMTEDETDNWMYEYLDDHQVVGSEFIKNIKVEDNPDLDVKDGKTLKELAIEKIQTMTDEEIIRRIFK